MNSNTLSDIILSADLKELLQLSNLLKNAEEYPAAQEINAWVEARIAFLQKQKTPPNFPSAH